MSVSSLIKHKHGVVHLEDTSKGRRISFIILVFFNDTGIRDEMWENMRVNSIGELMTGGESDEGPRGQYVYSDERRRPVCVEGDR